MSYEIVKKIRVTGEKVEMLSASNNVDPRTFEWWEYARSSLKFEEKISGIFECALDGSIGLQSSCGKFYRIYKTLEELENNLNSMLDNSLMEFDYAYKTNFSGKRKGFLAAYGTDLYFGRDPKNFELFAEDFVREFKQAQIDKVKEWEEADMVPIRSASWADVFAKGEYDVLADREDNIWLCKRDQYDNAGTLSEASKALKIPAPKQLSGELFGVLSGSFRGKKKAEILDWYKDRPLTRAAKDVAMDQVQKILNGINLPEYAELPWLDFDVEAL